MSMSPTPSHIQFHLSPQLTRPLRITHAVATSAIQDSATFDCTQPWTPYFWCITNPPLRNHGKFKWILLFLRYLTRFLIFVVRRHPIVLRFIVEFSVLGLELSVPGLHNVVENDSVNLLTVKYASLELPHSSKNLLHRSRLNRTPLRWITFETIE